MGILSGETFDIECPECDATIEISPDDVGKTIVCPNCKVEISLQDDGFVDELNKADELLDDFFKNL